MQRDPNEILSFGALHRDAVDADVQNVSRVEETAPEPREILTRRVLDTAKEITRRWMLESPGSDCFQGSNRPYNLLFALA